MKDIVVVGGGTAGWMAAIAVASRFPDKVVTVIEPDAIPPIGVGESVTGVVMSFVKDPLHGLSLRDFFRRCDVTFKAGIWYKDWRGPGTDYLSPIDSPPDYFRNFYECHVEDFYALMAAGGDRVGDAQLYGRLMRAHRTDYFRNPDGTVNDRLAQVSCHFDSLKFGGWLKEHGLGRPNVRRVDDAIAGFDLDPETGFVSKVRTKSGRDVPGDFFFDCTGFHRLLLAKAYRPGWRSYADHIRVDSAIPFFQPYAPGRPMPTYTTATAMPHGWMWQIPTQSRLGRGYVFSSRYVDAAGAVADLRAAGLDPGDDPRVLRFEPGRLERQWVNNVCAVGLSGGFVEPLESSTIHGMYVQLRLLTDLYLPHLTRASARALADQYNALVDAAYEDYVEFVSFHYHAGRDDTEFWRDYQKPAAIVPRNQARMEKWRHAFPVREDFHPVYTQRAGHTTGLVIWAPVLCALGFMDREAARRSVDTGARGRMLRENVERYVEVRDTITATALTGPEAIRFCREE